MGTAPPTGGGGLEAAPGGLRRVTLNASSKHREDKISTKKGDTLQSSPGVRTRGKPKRVSSPLWQMCCSSQKVPEIKYRRNVRPLLKLGHPLLPLSGPSGIRRGATSTRKAGECYVWVLHRIERTLLSY